VAFSEYLLAHIYRDFNINGTYFQDDEYYDMIFKSTNGLLIPGGAVSLKTSGNLIFSLFSERDNFRNSI
jgi:hypothetical protein